MIKLKKTGALIIAAVMMMQNAAFAYNANKTPYEELFADGFNTYVTNSQPNNINISGMDTNRIVEIGNKNKALSIDMKNDTSDISVPIINSKKEFFISMDIAMTGKGSDVRIGFADSTGKEFYPIYIDENGDVKSIDGKYICGVGNKFSELTISVNLEMKMFTIYRNGRIVLEQWNITDAPDLPSEIKISAQPDDTAGNLYIDNIRIYNGSKYTKRNIKEVFNPEEKEFSEEVILSDPKRIIYKNDFEDEGMELAGINISKKDSEIGIGEDSRNNNHFIKIDKASTGDCYIEYSNDETLKSMVIEADIRTDNGGIKGNLFYIRDSKTNTSQVNETLLNLNDTTLSAKGGSVIANMMPYKYYKISAVINISKNSVDFYIDGKSVVKDVKLSNNRFRSLDVVRFYISEGQGSLIVDNFNIYGGDEPRDISNEESVRESKFVPEATAIRGLSGKSVINTYTQMMFANGEKEDINGQTLISGNKSYVTRTVFEKLTGTELKSELTDVITKDGNEYVSLTECIDLFTKLKWYDDNHGCIFISENAITGNEDYIVNGNMYVSFKRLTEEELKEKFYSVSGENGGQHPRLLVKSEDFERVKNEKESNPVIRRAYEQVKTNVEKYFALSPTGYNLDGDKLLNMSVQAKDRIMELAFLYNVDGDERYAQRAWEEMQSIAAFPDWHPKHFLDAGEMTAAMGIGYDWLYSWLSNDQRKIVSDAIMKLGLKQAYSTYFDKSVWWNTSRLNWNIVCNGGTMVGALAIAETDPEYIFKFIHENLRSQEYLWYHLNSGGWEESVHYWDYVLEYMTYTMSTVNNTFGDDLGFMKLKGVNQFGYYSTYMSSYQGMYNIHDAFETYINSPFMDYLASYFNDDKLNNSRLHLMEMGNFTPDVIDAIWYKGDGTRKDIDFERDKYYDDIIQAVTMRESWIDKDGAFAAIHGGGVLDSHNHWDAGTFVYDVLGERWAIDLGWENYTNSAASSDKYRMRAEGHNVLVINPDNGPGQDKEISKVEKTESGEHSAYTIVDTTPSYSSWVNNSKRGMMLTDDRRSLIIRDEFELKDKSEVYWFMNTKADVRKIDDHTMYLIQNGRGVKLSYSSNVQSELTTMRAEPLPSSPKISQAPNTGVTKIAIKLTSSGNTNITVKLSPLGENAEKSKIIDTPLSQWILTDGLAKSEIRDDTEASMVYVDGKPIKDFSPEISTYRIDHVAEDAAPIFTVDTDSKYNVSIEYTDDYINGMSLIKLEDPTGEKHVKFYCIKYRFIGPMNDVLGYERYRFYNMEVSSVQQPENPDISAYDQNMGTRWSAQGLGEWAIADLGEIKEIDAVAMAFWMGQQRKFCYDIYVSQDGENYEKVIDHYETSGTTEDFEVVEIPRTKAQYVKYVGYGNSVNLWNNVLEFGVLKKK